MVEKSGGADTLLEQMADTITALLAREVAALAEVQPTGEALGAERMAKSLLALARAGAAVADLKIKARRTGEPPASPGDAEAPGTAEPETAEEAQMDDFDADDPGQVARERDRLLARLAELRLRYERKQASEHAAGAVRPDGEATAGRLVEPSP